MCHIIDQPGLQQLTRIKQFSNILDFPLTAIGSPYTAFDAAAAPYAASKISSASRGIKSQEYEYGIETDRGVTHDLERV